MRYLFFACFLVLSQPLFAEDTQTEKSVQTKEPLKEELEETVHKITIQGKELSYLASAGTLILKNTEQKDKASIFYVAYKKQNTGNQVRPITFCFNGGPGSSSVWLHLGAFGPRRIVFENNSCINFPYSLIDNESTLLETTDLVFIDPVSTGYSKSCPGEDVKQFHEVESDIKWMAEFIRLYTTKFNLWHSPKFVAGESYGTLRAVGVANELHDQHKLDLQGLILISSVLNFQMISDLAQGNEIAYLLSLPSFAATAWYHQKLSPEMQKKPLELFLKEVERFSLEEYSVALLKGDLLSDKEKEEIAIKLSKYIGLSPSYILQSDLRIPQTRFSQQLLLQEKQNFGRFDSRVKGWVVDACQDCAEYDPSAERIICGISATFNHYLNAELNVKKEEPYFITNCVRPWDYSKKASNRFLNVSNSLKESLTVNPHLCIFVASGYFDLATPYFSTLYTFEHLGLHKELKKNIKLIDYEGGHMMYSSEPILKKLNHDISNFIHSCLNTKKE